MKELRLLLPPWLRPAARAIPRERPEGMVYSVDDRPPLPVLAGMGLQHALLALVFTLYAAVAGQAIGLDERQTAAYVSATVLVMGLSTIVQALPWRLGAGMLLVTIPGVGRMAIQIGFTLHYGLGAVMRGTIVAGFVAIAMARLVPRLRPLLPPEVVGVVLIMIGITLVGNGVPRSVGLANGQHQISGTAAAAAIVTIAVIMGLAVWGSPRWRRLSMPIGALAGTAVAMLTGAHPPGHMLRLPTVAAPMFDLDVPWPEFRLAPIVTLTVIQLVAIMDQAGNTMSMDRITDARWRRADMGLLARAVTGLGIGTLLFGMTGTLTGGTSAANVGLAHASGVAAWRVGVAAGLFLVLASFFPLLSELLVHIPPPVVGGVLLYGAAFMISAGIELVMSRLMNGRRAFTVGLAVAFGTGVMLVPELAQQSPAWLRDILHSGATVGALAAIGLNIIFRIGTKQTQQHALARANEAHEAAEALERDGRLWGVRADVVTRAGLTVGEALEALRDAGMDGPVTLTASFDEFNLVTTLTYTGRALRLTPDGMPDAAALLDARDDDLDAAMRRVSANLVHRLADRVRSSQRGDTASLLLSFNH